MMKQASVLIAALMIVFGVNAQTALTNKLQAAWRNFTGDNQLKYASTGFCVMNASTGQVLFEKNSNTGLAPASSQKVITSIAAFEALGNNYQFKTRLGYAGKITTGKLDGDLIIEGSGDPTLASSRYTSTGEDLLLKNILLALQKAGINEVTGHIIGTDKGFDLNPVPDGWIWSDMGNYYGAGHWAINWNENEYKLFSKTGKSENDAVQVTATEPLMTGNEKILNDVTTGKPGTGDGSIIYAAPYTQQLLFQGKLEPGRSRFKVRGAYTDASRQALTAIKSYLQANGINIEGEVKTHFSQVLQEEMLPANVNYFYDHLSPGLDSIVYWFMRESINLYGEALLRTIGLEKNKFGSTDKGIDWVRSFYNSNGIDKEALHLYDGSGLSPANRVTPFAMAKALQYAKGRPWFSYFYDALPTYNGMKLKSGTINRVKCYAGYHTSKSGNNYIITLMVNNYNGSTASLVSKMFTLLDELK